MSSQIPKFAFGRRRSVCEALPNTGDLSTSYLQSISAFETTTCYGEDWFAMAATGVFYLLISLPYFTYSRVERKRAPHKLSGANKVCSQSIPFWIEDFRTDGCN